MPSVYFDARLPRFPDHVLAPFEHGVERYERVGVVALVARAFDQPEHRAEIHVAVAGLEMNLVAVAPRIGEAHFTHALPVERRNEAFDALRDEVRVVGGEAEPE